MDPPTPRKQRSRAVSSLPRKKSNLTVKTSKAAQRIAEPDVARGEIAETFATLETLATNLGSAVLQILAAPEGLEVKIGEPVIYDCEYPPSIEPGDVVFAVGLRADDPRGHELVKQAGSSGAAAVVFKVRQEANGLDETAHAERVALVGIRPEMTWSQAFAFFKTATASAGIVTGAEAWGASVGDLFSLANAVAAMVGGPTTIEDPQSRILAFSNFEEPIDEPRRETILGRRVPEPLVRRLHEEGVFRELWATEDVIRVALPDKDVRPRLAIAVRAGGEILGSIWVAQGRRPLGQSAKVALREAAQIAALHLIRHRVDEDLDRRRRGDVLRSVLEGRGSVELMARQLGTEAKSPFTVIAFEMQTHEEPGLALQRERVQDLVALYCEALSKRTTCASIDKVIYVLISTVAPPKEARLKFVAEGAIQHAEKVLRVRLHVGIGSTVSHLKEVPHSRWEADQVLRVLESGRGGLKVADIEEVRANTILLELGDFAAERPHLLSAKVRALVASDAQRGTSYVPTLRAYLEAFGDSTRAAAAMKVHPNTFRYRIRRLVELSSLDLDNADERLVTQFQLKLL